MPPAFAGSPADGSGCAPGELRLCPRRPRSVCPRPRALPARSASAAFPYRRLGSCRETAGHASWFERGTCRSRLMVSGRMEVDLLCAEARPGHRTDGAQHLADAEAYRRDRRKQPRTPRSRSVGDAEPALSRRAAPASGAKHAARSGEVLARIAAWPTAPAARCAISPAARCGGWKSPRAIARRPRLLLLDRGDRRPRRQGRARTFRATSDSSSPSEASACSGPPHLFDEISPSDDLGGAASGQVLAHGEVCASSRTPARRTSTPPSRG